MIISYNQDEERAALAKAALPESPIAAPVLEAYQSAMDQLQEPIVEAVKAELEIYRNYPKRGSHDGDFNPREPTTCFMGKGFLANHGLTDSELKMYREAVGRFEHPTWGHCSILECWAAAHFPDYPEMVRAAFDYGWEKVDEMPNIRAPHPVLAWTASHEKGLSQNRRQERDSLIAQAWEMGADHDTITELLVKFDEDEER